MPIRRIKKRRLPDVVAENMAEAIINGEFAAGEKLPPERELAERFGVSRNVVREAINELRSRGLLESRQGSGSVVGGRFHKPVSDILGIVAEGKANGEGKLLELRRALEVDVVRLAAERATEEDVAELGRILAAYEEAGADMNACAALDLAFHRALAQAAHNELFGVVLSSVAELLAQTRRAALERSGVEVAAKSHARILAAVKARRPSGAVKAMEEHLAITRERLVESGKGETR